MLLAKKLAMAFTQCITLSGQKERKTVLDVVQLMSLIQLGLGHLRQDIKKKNIQRECDA